jgi:hypothetical protein
MAETRDANGSAVGQKSLNGDSVAHDKSTLGLTGHLTPTQLAAHLACPHLTQLDRQRREGLLQIEFSPDSRLDALRERGRQHETAYVESLRSEGRSICDLPLHRRTSHRSDCASIRRRHRRRHDKPRQRAGIASGQDHPGRHSFGQIHRRSRDQGQDHHPDAKTGGAVGRHRSLPGGVAFQQRCDRQLKRHVSDCYGSALEYPFGVGRRVSA